MKNKKEKKIITRIFSAEIGKSLELPLIKTKIKAGFPSPASDYVESTLDLNEHLIQHPSATFFLRVEGNSMINAGIRSGDLLVVDRAVQVDSNNIIIASIDEELTVKRMKVKKGKYYLIPENDEFNPIEVTPEMEFSVWGVVTHVIHRV
ncbi:MAG: translesion error-prone DNA polymerase V autoproteolytic subunit [Candidatus Cloacimonadota bacterium]|nr:translesion error-prone DNA polymerase V autoproteolytic subunit [Candidatus Cloacimonadota bacterium]